MSTKKVKLKKGVRITLNIFLFLLILGFVERSANNRPCGEIKINIHHQAGAHFLEEKDALRLLTNNGKDKIVGIPMGNISVKKLEQRLLGNIYVKKCQVAQNLKGTLFVDIQLVKPIARVVRSGKPDFYLDSLGKVLPVVEKFSARVMIVTHEFTKDLPNFVDNEDDKQLFNLVQFIHNDPFLRAQISHIDVDRYGQVKLYPQIGHQVIEFGNMYNLAVKFDKLKLFYKKIIPLKGWNAYKRVNLRYQNQIVCE